MKKVILIVIIIILLIGIKNNIASISSLSGGTKVVGDLKKQLEDKKQENSFLAEKLKYVKSNDYVENEARQKLGLVKNGEYVVVASEAGATMQEFFPAEKAEPANWQKWIALFF